MLYGVADYAAVDCSTAIVTVLDEGSLTPIVLDDSSSSAAI